MYCNRNLCCHVIVLPAGDHDHFLLTSWPSHLQLHAYSIYDNPKLTFYHKLLFLCQQINVRILFYGWFLLPVFYNDYTKLYYYSLVLEFDRNTTACKSYFKYFVIKDHNGIFYVVCQDNCESHKGDDYCIVLAYSLLCETKVKLSTLMVHSRVLRTWFLWHRDLHYPFTKDRLSINFNSIVKPGFILSWFGLEPIYHCWLENLFLRDYIFSTF